MSDVTCLPSSSVVTDDLIRLGQELRSALVCNERTDGTHYLTLKKGSPSWMLEAVHVAHEDEMPNDWRWDLAHAVAVALSDWDSCPGPSEDAWEIAAQVVESTATIWTGEVLRWYADDCARLAYVDAANEIYGAPSSSYIEDALQRGQHYAAEQGALKLLAFLGLEF